MQGWQERVVRYILCGLFSLLLAGCEEGSYHAPSEAADTSKITPLGGMFNSSETGTIQGLITWQGPIPQIPPLRGVSNPNFEPLWPLSEFEKYFPNPNSPRIDTEGGVGEVVVFLRQVDPNKSRPWEHPPVTVAFQNCQLKVRQGKHSYQTGFVRCGEAVQFVSLEHRYHVLRARQGDLFALTLPQPHQPRKRCLSKKGIVELSSGADYYWLRGYLFVSNHPYFTRTNSRGEFTLGQVPAGEYELVAWLPNWIEASHHHNPENMCIHRFFFKSPVEQTCTIQVKSEEVSTASFSFRTDLFGKESSPISVTSR